MYLRSPLARGAMCACASWTFPAHIDNIDALEYRGHFTFRVKPSEVKRDKNKGVRLPEFIPTVIFKNNSLYLPFLR